MLIQFSASEIVDIVKLVNYEMKLKAAVEGNSVVIQLNWITCWWIISVQ